MVNQFYPYFPSYSLSEKMQRYGDILQATTSVASHLVRRTQNTFAASVEITDRCNAGCHYCYVYPPDWNQNQRVQGYMQLSSKEHRLKEKQVFETLERLYQQKVIHVTLVGGETALAPKAIQKAAQLFPIVWVVTNGAAKLPKLNHSTIVFVSIDGPPDYHNHSRDPLDFFAKHRYGNLTGMSAAIAKNINESERGAYCHVTLTRSSLEYFPETVDWLVRDFQKLRGIVVSGAAAKDLFDPVVLRIEDRQTLKQMIAQQAKKYGWKLFPFNQPKVNEFLFEKKHTIEQASDCSVAKRVTSLDFNGKSVGKCVLRDETLCQTCVCNITGLARAVDQIHLPTIKNVLTASFG